MENNANNCDLLNKGFDLLLEALDPYVMRELTQAASGLQKLRHGAQGRSKQGRASRYGRYLGQRRMACARYHESLG